MSNSEVPAEEIRARVVVLSAPHADDAGDEWAHPELEAFHLPSPAHQPPTGFLAGAAVEQPATLPAPPTAAAAHRSCDTSTPSAALAAAPPPPPSPPPSPAAAAFETEQPPNAKASASSSSSTAGANDNNRPTPPAALRDLFRFADGLDYVLMLVDTLIHGCSLPIFLLFFANLVDSFGSHADDPDIMVCLVIKYAFYFLVVGAAIWASSWVEISCWMWTDERQSTRMRIRYLDTALRQDVSFFDTDVHVRQ